MSGQRIGLWTVLEQAGNLKGGGATWRAVCDCGREGTPLGADLRSGKSLNCGCVTRARLGQSNRTHGGTAKRERLYWVWQNMRRRCYRPSNASYPIYGGRGIRVCPEWLDYAVFRAWAHRSGYRADLTLERVDVNGHYEPGNCTWADAITQSNNRRFVRKTSDGRPAPIVARENGVTHAAYAQRILAGWSVDDAVTLPMRTRIAPPNKRGANGQFLPRD